MSTSLSSSTANNPSLLSAAAGHVPSPSSNIQRVAVGLEQSPAARVLASAGGGGEQLFAIAALVRRAATVIVELNESTPTEGRDLRRTADILEGE